MIPLVFVAFLSLNRHSHSQPDDVLGGQLPLLHKALGGASSLPPCVSRHHQHEVRKFRSAYPRFALRQTPPNPPLPTGTKRVSITLRERKETLPKFLLPIPDCRCGVQATLKARVLKSGAVDYLFQCDRGQGQCGFFQSRGGLR